ncbi:MAG: 2,3-bisphosphoglycerate-independent phosphoglycerate mutase [Oscillospiraceae bacterium]|nr:2,3-bisphosphoglycerate-independent phosphoglycerate mutase [Oscillospiraceae bacterium]
MAKIKPILLVVMDGIGFSQTGIGDAVEMAKTPTLDYLLANCPNGQLKAHGAAVGLPSDDDMGNSEVGHNALGCGQVYSQGAKLVNEAIESGKMFKGAAWNELVDNCKAQNTLHFIGLLSDGNVHSNIAHLFDMLKQAKHGGVKKARIHILLDGRDVPATSALDYVEKLENVLVELNDGNFDGRIASGGGRMKVTMDRYQADWAMVERGWKTHVWGEGRIFGSVKQAIETYRGEKEGIIDQDLPAFVIGENDAPIGKITDGDSVILFNFRGDRAIEISMAFDYDEFDYFERGKKPDVCYAGMLQYDGDLELPVRYLVNPPEIKETLSELLVANNINQYAISETQKFGHVTYFWNGNKSGKFSEELETYKEIPSDKIRFDKKPEMKSKEITEDLIEVIKSGKYDFIRCNFPNGDMVGHTGNLEAAIVGVESVDASLEKLVAVCKENGVTLIVTADHGNADEMLEKDKKGNIAVRTAHSLNKVPFIIYDEEIDYKIIDGDYGLANVAPTVAKMFGLTPPASWEKSMI